MRMTHSTSWLHISWAILTLESVISEASQPLFSLGHILSLLIIKTPPFGKESACNTEDPRLIPGLGRSPGEGNSNPLQYSFVGNPKDREAWWATVNEVAKSQTQLSN